MKPSTFCAAAVLAFLAAGTLQVQALTFTNNEQKTAKITVIQGDRQDDISLTPGQSVDGLCADSCLVRLENGDEYDLFPEDVVSLEEGSIYFEAPAQGDGSVPPQR